MTLRRPGPSYYIWLRWITGRGGRASPPDPKPWRRLVRGTVECPDGRVIKTWRIPDPPGDGSDTSTKIHGRLPLRTRLGLWLLKPYAIERVIAARRALNDEPEQDSRHGGYVQGVFSTWFWIAKGRGMPS